MSNFEFFLKQFPYCPRCRSEWGKTQIGIDRRNFYPIYGSIFCLNDCNVEVTNGNVNPFVIILSLPFPDDHTVSRCELRWGFDQSVQPVSFVIYYFDTVAEKWKEERFGFHLPFNISIPKIERLLFKSLILK